MNRRRSRVLALVIALVVSGYALLLRPWMLAWGATVDERTRPWPGDDLVPNPTHTTTHAVTIAAPPRAIWPWLVQMGQDRAGFYTHNWVERLLRSGIPDVAELHPEWQALRAGDLMRTSRELRPGHPLGWTVEMVEPGRALVLRSRSLPVGTYAYILQPCPDGATRLIARDRAAWRWWQAPFRALLFEPLHAYMQTGQLRGIKRRVEGHDAGRLGVR